MHKVAEYSSRDYEDVLNGRLFLVDVGSGTRDRVMFTIYEKAKALVNSGNTSSHSFPWYLKNELEAEIKRIIQNTR